MGMLRSGSGQGSTGSVSERIHAPAPINKVRSAALKPSEASARKYDALAAVGLPVSHAGVGHRFPPFSVGLRTKDEKLHAFVDEDWLEIATDALKASAETLAKEAVLMAEAAARLSAGGDRIDRMNSENKKLLDALVNG